MSSRKSSIAKEKNLERERERERRREQRRQKEKERELEKRREAELKKQGAPESEEQSFTHAEEARDVISFATIAAAIDDNGVGVWE